MKKNLFSLLTFIFTILQVAAQDAPMVVGGAEKGNINATMEILSQKGTKGFMPPRLTTAEVTALGSKLDPASNGLTVFNTETNCLQYWKGDKWSDCSTYSNAELTFDCTASTMKGVYNVDKIAGDNEFMEVKVNVTKAGPFVLYTNTQNGIRFYLSTILDKGEQTIQVPAVGTPQKAGSFTYNLFDQSANPICTANANFTTDVVENKAAFTINCDQSSFVGTIFEGSSASGQTLKLKVEISKSGNYYIKTNTVHGLWFEGSGTVNLGTTEIILDLKGSVDTVPGDGKIAFNFFDKNNASLTQCAVTIYVSAEKAIFTPICSGAVLSGGVGTGTGVSTGAQLFYAGYVFTENDYIKIKVNVTRPGFIDLKTEEQGSDGEKMRGMLYAYSGYVDKAGIQDIYLRPINQIVPPLEDSDGPEALFPIQRIFDNITKTSICNLFIPSISIFKQLATLGVKSYDPAKNPVADAYLNNKNGIRGIDLFMPIVPESGLDIEIKSSIVSTGLYSFVGVANGMTLKSNQGLYTLDQDTLTFTLSGTPNQGGVVVFQMFDTITGLPAGSISIKMTEWL